MNPIRRVVAYIRRVNEPREPASFDEFVERYAVPGNHFGIHRPGSEAIGTPNPVDGGVVFSGPLNVGRPYIV